MFGLISVISLGSSSPNIVGAMGLPICLHFGALASLRTQFGWLKMAKMMPKMTKMRSRMAKMRPKMAKMRPKMAKMRP